MTLGATGNKGPSGGARRWPAKWMFSNRGGGEKAAASNLPSDEGALLAPPPAAQLSAGHIERQKQLPADEEERAIRSLEDALDADVGVQDAFIPARSTQTATEQIFSSVSASGRITPKSIRASARTTGRSVVFSTRSLPGYVSQDFSGMGAPEMRDLYLSVRNAAAAGPNTGRVPARGIVPLSAIAADRDARPFHDRKWEVALRARHEQRIDPRPRGLSAGGPEEPRVVAEATMGQLLPAVDRGAKATIEDTGGAARQPPPALRGQRTEASASVCMISAPTAPGSAERRVSCA